ncbi:hypothetical protein [Chitinolyticbacter albus]|uniref:hypothetical protein n=1 Tax=Chitinolyticbacter albus TaxID=2961951 RepID=UPI00210C9566|nr:hypothetical protein [Chitinolyticbacter albus]
MFGLFKKGSEEDSALVKRALSPETVAVVSASCCVRGTADIDAETEAAAHAALESAHLDWPVVTVTVTQAQSSLGKISGELDSGGSKVAQQVSELFMSHGLSAFPVLIVNQRLVSYGGAPDKELVGKALPAASNTSQALH